MASALQRYPEIKLIAGTELSTDIPGSEIHILGYFMDVEDQDFQRELARFREGRLGRGQEMVNKLQQLGMDVTWERVQEIAGEASVAGRMSPRRCWRRVISRRLRRPSIDSSAATALPTLSGRSSHPSRQSSSFDPRVASPSSLIRVTQRE